mgnify:CR=1 FL=1
MCGLAGIILKQEDRSDKDLSSIVGGFKEMLLEADTRGGHATGFALIDRFGGYILVKRPLDAYKFFNDSISHDALDLVFKDTTCILGHTRYATLGKPEKNRNNHPIRTGNTIGTHNGSIHNHKELFKKYDMDRYADVDSEAIFRLYETSESAKDFSENRLPNVRGRVAIVWSDLEYPEYVYMVKGNNPLKMAYIPGLSIYAYGSTLDIIKASGWTNYKPINVFPNTMLRINTRTLKIRTKNIVHKKPKPSKTYYYNSKIGAYTKPATHYGKNYTVPQFVPRYSWKEQGDLFKKVRTSDGSTIRKIK